MVSETKDEDQTMIAYRESDVLENIEEEESGIPLPPKVMSSSLSYKNYNFVGYGMSACLMVLCSKLENKEQDCQIKKEVPESNV
jgi:hypothetical protein